MLTFGPCRNVSQSKTYSQPRSCGMVVNGVAICLQSQVDWLYCAVPSLASIEVSISDYLDCLRTGNSGDLKA